MTSPMLRRMAAAAIIAGPVLLTVTAAWMATFNGAAMWADPRTALEGVSAAGTTATVMFWVGALGAVAVLPAVVLTSAVVCPPRDDFKLLFTTTGVVGTTLAIVATTVSAAVLPSLATAGGSDAAQALFVALRNLAGPALVTVPASLLLAVWTASIVTAGYRQHVLPTWITASGPLAVAARAAGAILPSTPTGATAAAVLTGMWAAWLLLLAGYFVLARVGVSSGAQALQAA